jgi:hypothetical protein
MMRSWNSRDRAAVVVRVVVRVVVFRGTTVLPLVVGVVVVMTGPTVMVVMVVFTGMMMRVVAVAARDAVIVDGGRGKFSVKQRVVGAGGSGRRVH